jgi:tetratricopeptide (TPR) repeat protein
VAVVDQYLKLREAQPQEPEYAYQLGKAFMKVSEWAFQRMKELNSRSPLLYQALASSYLSQGRDELAMRALEQAIQLDPQLPEVHLALADIYHRQGKLVEARRELEKELSIMPDSRVALDLKEKLGGAKNEPSR